MGRLAFLMALVGVGCITALWVGQCSGPRAAVDGLPTVLAPEQPGQPYRVVAAIRNTGPGHGEVQVTFRLRDRATGQTYQHIDRAQLEPGSLIQVVAEIPALPGDYEPSVQVDYPPG